MMRDLEAEGRKRGIGAAVIARVVRLNPNPKEGAMLRGWRPAPTLNSIRLYRDVIGKREFIASHGRGNWNRLPGHALVRDGKRVYVTRRAVEDQLWVAKAGRRSDDAKSSIDIEKVQAALDRAAFKALHGSRDERSGRYLALIR